MGDEPGHGKRKRAPRKPKTGFDGLLERVPVDREAGIADQVLWVHNHLADPWGDIIPEGVPSRGALGLLGWAKDNESEFRRTYHSKMLPRVDANGPAGFDDDGGELIALIERLERYKRAKAGTQDHVRSTGRLWESCATVGEKAQERQASA